MLTSLISFIVSYLIISFAEHYIHRYQMHMPGWMNRFEDWLYDNHQKIHHPAYRGDFTEADPLEHRDIGLRISIINTLTYLGLPILILTYLLPIFAVTFMISVVLHHLLWNLFHEEMHCPKGRFFRKLWFFKMLHRNHYFHHMYPRTNFNIITLGADWFCGTLYRPSKEELVVWQKTL
jgi:hypothetical protein